MRHNKKVLAALAMSLLLAKAGTAQSSESSAAKAPAQKTSRTSKKARRPKKESAEAIELREMRDKLTEQQAQIDSLREQVVTRDQQVTAAQQSATEAQAGAASAAAASQAAQAQTQQNQQDVQQLQTQVTDLNQKNDTLTQTVITDQANLSDQINSPTAIHYKGVTIQPIGFAAFEGVWRQRSTNSDINTPFNTIPFPSANEGHISELNFSGRQSRLGALVTGDTGRFRLSGYVEADFLSSGITSNNNQSDSYTLRFRQFWGQAANKTGFAITGGQMWSLVTENARGTNNRTEVLPNTVDPQYMVGFSWTRQPGLRIQKSFGNPLGRGGVTAAVAVEQAQLTNITVGSAVASAIPQNYFYAGPGVNGGLYNSTQNYANNVAPDVIAKIAFDTRRSHSEIGGIGRFMRDVYYPITNATVATNGTVTYSYATQLRKSTTGAGGGFASTRVMPTKWLEVGASGMFGTGVGRYGSSQLADATINSSGQLVPVNNYHALASLVTHEGKNFDIFAYYGGEYAQRTTTTAAGNNQIGYGPRNLNDTGCYALPTPPTSSAGLSPVGGTDTPVNCASPTRYIQEGMAGFIWRAYNSPKYGRLQYTFTYSLLQRNLWSGVGSASTPTGPRAQDNMVHVGMRYYIP